MNLDNFTVESFFCFYVAFLRSLYIIHQNNHWKVKGNYFYANHQLFQRLYEKSGENADKAAEKMIGLFTDKSFNTAEQAKCISAILNNFTDEDEIQNSLKAEKTFLSVSDKFYSFLEENDKLTLGLDDMIMSIHSDSEESVYLLSQSKED